jgi:hypothetical protein
MSGNYYQDLVGALIRDSANLRAENERLTKDLDGALEGQKGIWIAVREIEAQRNKHLAERDSARAENERLRIERDEALGLLNANEDITRDTATENERLREALSLLREYAANVWFDEARTTDEEIGLMARARAALSCEPTGNGK